MEGFEKVRKLGYNVNCRSEIAEKLRIMCEGMHDQKKNKMAENDLVAERRRFNGVVVAVDCENFR